ncbi:MAG: hypothetical protein NZ694_02240 [Tepidimonas sp.]|uniref:CHC2-type zinc finger protein n=1 Tax=Tepidimonas ignava TaxID=114249 RepID=A0A4R3LCR5_9BURK|nr:hypothetical protein [Tepidimonas ignava]MCS6810073.1 hypothetical protein [Tepidimonas sp.]MCX7692685.1 hypothetical protein [Tepidimonas taiwanensis]TCS95256.1 hypothetical protein EDC36_1153 [Tepidimonas ignava]TSE19805.1 hypothetical protein Tigna_02134 [Tepidimonas ignava]
MLADATRAATLLTLPADWPQQLAGAAERYERAGGVLPAGHRGRFDRERLPDALTYCAEHGIEGPRERRGQWRTFKCPRHGGWSLRINVEASSWCCMAGCGSGGDVLSLHRWLTDDDFVTAARVLGAWVDDPTAPPVRRDRRPAGLSAADALTLLRSDALLIAQEAARACRIGVIETAVKDALLAAAARILRVCDSREDGYAPR